MLLLSVLIAATAPRYVVFDPVSRAAFRAQTRQSIERRLFDGLAKPSGVARQFIDRGLVGVELSQQPLARERFQALLVERGLAAVVAQPDADTQALPVLVARAAPEALAALGRVEATRIPGVYRVFLGPGIVEPDARAIQARVLPNVRWIEPDRWLRLSTRAVVLNDPAWPRLWHLHASEREDVAPNAHVHADEAWETTRGNGSTIAIVDDGFSLVHPDLIDQFFSDGTLNPVASDIIDGDDDPTAETNDGHGTRVMGAAVARGDNSIGTAGVCPECRVIPIRLFTSNPNEFNANLLYGPGSLAAEAFQFAADHGARVINNSWGPVISLSAPKYAAMPTVISDVIRELARRGPPGQEGSEGVLFTWAAGNNGQLVSFDAWASDPRVLSVGASNAMAQLSSYSDIGPQIDLLAPSSNGSSALPRIETTDGNDSYSSSFGGTSAASPIAAGVAALVLAAHPELSLAQLFEVLLDSADRIDVEHADYDDQDESCTHGSGRINAAGAIALAAARQSDYAAGFTLHFELCEDGLDNDNNPATPDTGGDCTVCVPTRSDDPLDAIDNNCDGFVDNPRLCVPNGSARCESCTSDAHCQPGFSCISREGTQLCLETCSLTDKCRLGTQCKAGVCLPLVGSDPVECSAIGQCSASNGGIETCDGRDNDCNGAIDDVGALTNEQLEQDSDCQRGFVGVCGERHAQCQAGAWRCIDHESYEALESSCDGLDNDCDGGVDEQLTDCSKGTPDEDGDARGGCQSLPASSPWLLVALIYASRLKIVRYTQSV